MSKCKICEKDFGQQKSLKNHIAYVHEKSLRFCVECDEMFDSNWQLKNHISIVHCSRCGSLFSVIDTVHICVHDGKKVYKCRIVYNMCDYVSDRLLFKWEMKKHISADHIKEELFECFECDALFISKENLNQHISAFHGD